MLVQAAQEPAIRHAMQVREAVCTHDWSAFFRLYAAAPNMGRALMDMAAPSMRWTALNALVKTFKPSIAVPFVARVLGFAPRLTSPLRPAPGANPGAAVEPIAGQPGDGSPVQEAEPHSGAGPRSERPRAAASGGAADECGAGTEEGSSGGDAALVVLPGCAQAVYKGKYQVAVRTLRFLTSIAVDLMCLACKHRCNGPQTHLRLILVIRSTTEPFMSMRRRKIPTRLRRRALTGCNCTEQSSNKHQVL